MSAAITPVLTGSRVYLRAVSSSLMEIHCQGHVRVEDTSYMPDLAGWLRAQSRRASLLYHTLDITGFSPTFPVQHFDFFRAHRHQIKHVAVVYSLRSVEMAVLAVRLATNIDIRGFPSSPAALRWFHSEC